MTFFARRNRFARFLAFVVLLAAPRVSAFAADCQVLKPLTIGRTQGTADAMRNGECYASVQPTSFPDMTYRSFMFFNTGLLMVFDSYGKGSNSSATSAREFYFFPRSGPVELRMDASAGTVEVTMANGDVVAVDTATAQIRSSSRGDVKVSKRVSRNERGGVEFSHYKGLMLDTGFMVGESPAEAPDGQSLFRNAFGHTCQVSNREIFSYSGRYDHSFKFNDAQLSAWLKKRCPALHVGF
jgi:hypothetical protein